MILILALIGADFLANPGLRIQKAIRNGSGHSTPCSEDNPERQRCLQQKEDLPTHTELLWLWLLFWFAVLLRRCENRLPARSESYL
jgi:hypothetical protein